MTIELTPAQFQALVGMLDIAIKQIGIRAMEDDIVGIMATVKAAAVKATEEMQDAA